MSEFFCKEFITKVLPSKKPKNIIKLLIILFLMVNIIWFILMSCNFFISLSYLCTEIPSIDSGIKKEDIKSLENYLDNIIALEEWNKKQSNKNSWLNVWKVGITPCKNNEIKRKTEYCQLIQDLLKNYDEVMNRTVYNKWHSIPKALANNYANLITYRNRLINKRLNNNLSVYNKEKHSDRWPGINDINKLYFYYIAWQIESKLVEEKERICSVGKEIGICLDK